MAHQRYDPLYHRSEDTLIPTSGIETISSDSRSLLREGDSEQLPLGPLNTEGGGFVQGKASGSTESTDGSVKPAFARRPTSPAALWELFLDLLFAIPAILFLVYAGFVSVHDGKPLGTDPVPTLRMLAGYGPTVFPIVFAAIAANLLKAIAAWKLERGISVLSLQFLLRSRTVFSAFTAPLIMGTASYITPLILVLWVLSPLGGQATLRVVGEAPSSSQESWNYRYLDVRSPMLHSGALSSAGAEVLPAIIGAFTAALGSPDKIKSASQDAFGNIKIPMVEAYEASNRTQANGGWYDLTGEKNITYSSISGLPIYISDGLGLRGNHSFKMDTSYIYYNCTVSHGPGNSTEWWEYMNAPNAYTNGNTIVLLAGYHAFNLVKFNVTPAEVIFTTWSNATITNATCSLTTSFVEADIECHHSDCGVKRLRRIVQPKYLTALTVLDGVGPTGGIDFNIPQMSFFQTFVNATNTAWTSKMVYKRYGTPIEYYFTNPGAPYLDVMSVAVNPPRIWTLSDEIFSQRLSQLLNTFWIANIAPIAFTGSVEFSKNASSQIEGKPAAVDAEGKFTPDVFVLRANRAWLAVLVVSSITMLLAAVAAAYLGALRRGPDILDYTTSIIRDNPYVDIADINKNSMEDGSDQMKRLKNIRVCLGDVTPAQEKGHVAFATVGEAVPLGRQRLTRTYE
ncbi:hypothetical protein BKA56DRAFT_584514 [Ilyonectria sp. MPI-CAGE-AT-0026]|nr:hypothetical protein BKA56DRAFT_584514 [Ilyonectria sp. MPI-CAGE-AT-0026]